MFHTLGRLGAGGPAVPAAEARGGPQDGAIMSDPAATSAAVVRERARRGALTGVTAGLAAGYAQANLVIVPRDLAFDFLLFCVRNPKPCPLLDVTDPGSPVPRYAAPHADLRTDLPRYRVYRQGELVDEPTSIARYWADDLVAFLLGLQLYVRAGSARCGDSPPSSRVRRQRGHVPHQHRLSARRDVPRTARRLDAADPGAAGGGRGSDPRVATRRSTVRPSTSARPRLWALATLTGRIGATPGPSWTGRCPSSGRVG